MKASQIALQPGMAAPDERGASRGETTSFSRITTAVGMCIIAWIGWNAATGTYTPGSAFGYGVGIAGACMMATLLLYPLRKRVRFLKSWAPLKYWFSMHMLFGIAGPLLILFHSTFRMRSLNATVAMSCMILVAVSGIVGRFIYRKIHHGLYGARATREETQQAVTAQLAEVERFVRPLPAVQQEIERFAALASHRPGAWPARVLHFLTLPPRRLITQRRIARAIASLPQVDRLPSRAHLASLARTSRYTLRAIQRVAQFHAYERLFSLWHILHVPFVFMLVLSAIIHVVAVHMY